MEREFLCVCEQVERSISHGLRGVPKKKWKTGGGGEGLVSSLVGEYLSHLDAKEPVGKKRGGKYREKAPPEKGKGLRAFGGIRDAFDGKTMFSGKGDRKPGIVGRKKKYYHFTPRSHTSGETLVVGGIIWRKIVEKKRYYLKLFLLHPEKDRSCLLGEEGGEWGVPL